MPLFVISIVAIILALQGPSATSQDTTSNDTNRIDTPKTKVTPNPAGQPGGSVNPNVLSPPSHAQLKQIRKMPVPTTAWVGLTP